MPAFVKLSLGELFADEANSPGPNLVKIIRPFGPATLGFAVVLAEFEEQRETNLIHAK